MGHLKSNGRVGEYEFTPRAIIIGVITMIIVGLLSGAFTALIQHKITAYRVEQVEQVSSNIEERVHQLELFEVDVTKDISYIKAGVSAITTHLNLQPVVGDAVATASPGPG